MVTRISRSTRWVAAAVTAGLSAAALTACASSTDSGGDQTESIVIGMNEGLVPQFEEYAEVFNAMDTGVEVKITPVPAGQAEYIQQLVTQGLSKTLPDIVFNYDSLNQSLDANNLLFDMSPWLDEGKGGLAGDGFVPAFLEQYSTSADGAGITGLPVSADSTILVYNKSLFEQAGVTELPSEDWTLEDLYRVSEQITAAGGGAFWGLSTFAGQGGLLFVDHPILNAMGSNLYNEETGRFEFADEAGLKAWEKILEPYTEGWGSPYSVTAQTTDYFASGQTAMAMITRPTVATYRDTMTDDWDVANLPTLNGESIVGGGSYGLSITEASDKKDAAWKFLTWFYSKDGGMAEAEPNGVIPATTDGVESGTWLEDDSPIPASLIPVTQYAVNNAKLPPALPSEAQTELVPTLEAAAQEVLLGGKSIKEAYTAAQDKLNALLG